MARFTKPADLTPWEWLVQRFWEGVKAGEPDECWEWQKGRVTDGYGTIALDRQCVYSTHRLSYRINVGNIPPGMQVMHTCDNPPCCNPNHLKLGTNLDNVQDMINKRRGNVVLTREQVESIKIDPRTQRRIARDYRVTQSTISLIKRGKRWSKLD